jgi:hypothetical protein
MGAVGALALVALGGRFCGAGAKVERRSVGSGL